MNGSRLSQILILCLLALASFGAHAESITSLLSSCESKLSSPLAVITKYALKDDGDREVDDEGRRQFLHFKNSGPMGDERLAPVTVDLSSPLLALESENAEMT